MFLNKDKWKTDPYSQQALNILKDSASAAGIKGNAGTHTLRKLGVSMTG